MAIVLEHIKSKRQIFFCSCWTSLGIVFCFVPILTILVFLGVMFWAKQQDPFSRKWFTLKTADHHVYPCVAVLPKPQGRHPVIIYMHGSGGSLMTDGFELRQMAELGMAVVSLEYDQTNSDPFAPAFTALQQYLDRQPWADTNAIAWVGFGLGQPVVGFCPATSRSAPAIARAYQRQGVVG
jgi:hypothetical protein